MLEESWSQEPDGGFPSPCDDDSVKEVSSLASKSATQCSKSNNMDPIGNEFCATDAILNEFWPDIGNFEDVDRIFRSFDSTFGLGANNEDEFEWFSSSDVEGSGDVLKSDYIHSLDQSSVYPAPSAVKVDTNGLTSASPKESYSSNQLLAADSSRGPSFQVPLCDSVSMEKNAQHVGNKLENIKGVTGEVGTSTMEESSSVNSGLDEISLEAASFRQLQLVMEQLDLRTKLCIRDSLYRLAHSAEQRHNHANLNDSCCGDDRDTGGILVTEGANKFAVGFMDMERDTNPIDRSIAHLLFHRPSDSSAAIPLQDSLPYKTGTSVDCLQRPVDKLNVIAHLVKLMNKKHTLLRAGKDSREPLVEGNLHHAGAPCTGDA
ncbi:hypothetical protein M9H77_20730 [Catharanthus roseus]|uniref:Uncharacterized protein n=1 Tax=Catharanthus roseus TaxID=4058 RepID=A0ACC0AKB8_CATRO|nr:hypothetical protein M9H77_20730 [Catharanthus roseus]